MQRKKVALFEVGWREKIVQIMEADGEKRI